MSIKEKLIDLVKVRISLPTIKVSDVDDALNLSLSAFNMIPCVTYFTFEDEENIDQLKDILVTYASYVLLTAHSLVERGKEFEQVNNGVSFIPPNISDHCLSIARELWNNWESQVHALKESDSFYEDFVNEVEEE